MLQCTKDMEAVKKKNDTLSKIIRISMDNNSTANDGVHAGKWNLLQGNSDIRINNRKSLSND
jgi:hypothetical protein